MAGVTVSGQEGGQLVVSMGGTTLVQGDHATELQVSSDNPFQVVTSGADGGTPVTLTGGAMRAQQQWGTETLPNFREQITALRDQFAAAVNTLHQSGKDQDGNNGAAFFVADGQGNLTVNPRLSDPRRRWQRIRRRYSARHRRPGDRNGTAGAGLCLHRFRSGGACLQRLPERGSEPGFP
jgi:flagellar hook-associated protein FlgK